MIQSSGIVTAMVGLLQALPGKKLHERLRRQGRLVGATTGDNLDGSTNIVPRMTREALGEGCRGILRHIYAPGPHYRRIRTFLREYRPARTRGGWDWRNAHAFLRACLRLGILGRERFHYWGLLGWTLVHRPSCIALAVTLSIYGYHFRRTCRALQA